MRAPHPRMTEYLRRIATGRDQSKPLSAAHARDGMELILRDEVDPVQAGVFLIALRMKHETDDENRGILDALRAATATATADVPELLDLADPYDGFVRHLPSSPFLPAVIAACGLPTVSHGSLPLPPKFGLTHARILGAAGATVDASPADAARRLADPRIGWAYVDQSQASPSLFRLAELRGLLYKRPCLATLEKLCMPVRAARTHLFVGYVHRAYEHLLPVLALHAGYTTALALRGVEGGVLPPLHSAGKGAGFRDGGPAVPITIDPHEAGIESTVRAAPLPSEATAAADHDSAFGLFDMKALASRAASAGLAALEGAPGPTRDGLVLSGAVMLRHLRRFPSLSGAADAVRAALGTGEAKRRFQAGS